MGRGTGILRKTLYKALVQRNPSMKSPVDPQALLALVLTAKVCIYIYIYFLCIYMCMCVYLYIHMYTNIKNLCMYLYIYTHIRM